MASILIVDDERHIRNIVQDIFQREGYRAESHQMAILP